MLRRKKPLTLKRDLHHFDARRPLSKPKTALQDEFRKTDIPGETARLLMRLVYAALALAGGWFLYQCWRSWNIFS